MRTLDEVRGDIDRIDLQIRELFQQRMDFSKEVILENSFYILSQTTTLGNT